MKRLGSIAISLACLLFSAAPSPSAHAQAAEAPSEDANEIALAVGETRTISARNVKNYSEGIAGVVDVKLTTDASQFVIVGRKPGSTTLLLIHTDGSQRTLNINVFARSPDQVEKELEQLLAGMGVRTRRIGAQIVIDGQVATEADLRRVQQVASLYPNQVMSLAEIGRIGGAPRGGAEIKKHLIRIDFYFVQYDRNSSYGVGIAWPQTVVGNVTAEYNYDFLASAPSSATATISGEALPRLDLASRNGWAKVLKHATVITNNEAEASYSSGGEQNFAVNTGLTIGIEKILYGTAITVLPSYDEASRELHLSLVADVSDLTASAAGTPLPGRMVSKLTTNVSLKLGQSLVLSGIRSESLERSVTGLPGLSEIPLLGFLFGSHSRSRLETEGAIFVVPSVIQAVPTAGAEMVDRALRKFEEYDGDLEEVRAFDSRPGGGVDIPR